MNQSTVCFYQRGLRNRAVTSLFYDFWGPQRFLWVPKIAVIDWVPQKTNHVECSPTLKMEHKIGHKLHLGKKSTPMVKKWVRHMASKKNKSKIWGIRPHMKNYTFKRCRNHHEDWKKWMNETVTFYFLEKFLIVTFKKSSMHHVSLLRGLSLTTCCLTHSHKMDRGT